MQLSSLTLALAAGLAVNVQGAAILAPRNETAPVLINNVFCSDTNGAPTDLCKRLVNTLLNNRGVIVPSNVNGISLTSDRSICWIGWRDTITNMPQGNLIDAAATTIGKCGSDDAVSGWAENVNLNNVCSRQCLSDRLGCW
uniref:WD-like domain-containing protein n=1 Tax=Colletotrichum fructicola (strain Nara gc5) TaxID=1213859 RepID=L2FJN0_COLFN